jgi:ferritin-like metal-binding protein YciE
MPRNSHSKRDNNRQQSKEEKLVNYLNYALAIENAAVKRLQERTKEASLPQAKDRLKQHLRETKEQQSRLEQLISNLGGKATHDVAQLPISKPPKRLANALEPSFTDAEQQLVAAKEDAIIENAEIIMYDMLTQLSQVMGIGDAVPVLAQNFQEERDMADWLRANMPVMITKLYPEIQSSIIPNEQETVGGEQGGKISATAASQA